MKRLVILSTIIAGTLFASSAHSQVYVNAHIGFGIPVRRVYCAPPPPVVYQEPAPVYQDEYAPAPVNVVYENDFPGYTYYNYPSWNGHFRDRCYYEHYRPYFERDNRGYYDRGRFDHDRFEHERFEHRGYDRDRYDHDRFDHD